MNQIDVTASTNQPMNRRTWWAWFRQQRILPRMWVLALIYVIFCLVLFLIQEAILFPGQTLPNDLVISLPANITEVRLPVADVTLHGLHCRTTQPCQGVVYFLHGNAGHVFQWAGIAPPFLERGFDVFLLDYRGYGKSTGQIRQEADLLADATAGYQYLLQQYSESQIVLVGRSLGSGLVAYLATQQRPSLLILEAPYFSMRQMAAKQFPIVPSFLCRYPLRTYRWLESVQCPVMLIHGTKDQLIPFNHSERLLQHIRTQAKLFSIVGAGHNFLETYADYDTAISESLTYRQSSALPFSSE